MLNASVGVQRVLGRLRRPPSTRASSASTFKVRSLAAVRRTRHDVQSAVAGSRLAARSDRRTGLITALRSDRRSIVARLGHDRTVAVAVAAILLAASAISASAAGPAPATGGTNGPGSDVRIAIGGGSGYGHGGTINEDYQPTADTFALAAGTDPGTVDRRNGRRRTGGRRRPGGGRPGRGRLLPAPSKARSSRTAPCSSRSRSTPPSPTAAASSGPTRSSPATPSPGSPPSSASR